jgi:hypothetical protein
MIRDVPWLQGASMPLVELQQQDCYSVPEFARRNDIGVTLAYREIKTGHLIARKIGRRTIVTSEDAKAWRANLEKRQQPETQDRFERAIGIDPATYPAA